MKRMQKSLTVQGNSGLYNHTRNIEKGIENSLKKNMNRWKNNRKKLTKSIKNKTRKLRK